jgi:hypothetical protein
VVKKLSNMLQKLRSRGSKDDVINIQQNVGEGITMAQHKQGHIRLRGNKTKAMGMDSEPLVPCSGRLLESIERFMQPADVVRMSQVEKTRRLLTINLLIESAVKKSILDIKLVNRPGERDSKTEDDTDGIWLDDRTKCLVEVDAGLLRESTNHPTCFIAREATIGTKFMLEDPFT